MTKQASEIIPSSRPRLVRQQAHPLNDWHEEALDAPELLLNRELSLLAFTRRVLELASDDSVPLLERLRFLCISCTNLDEFFEVRVAAIHQRIQQFARRQHAGDQQHHHPDHGGHIRRKTLTNEIHEQNTDDGQNNDGG